MSTEQEQDLQEFIDLRAKIKKLVKSTLSAAVTDAVLGDEKPGNRAKILRLWLETLTFEKKANPRFDDRYGTFPETDYIIDLIGWLTSVIRSLESQH